MKARTSLLIVLVSAVFVLATVSRGYAAQTTSQERTDTQNQSRDNPNYSQNEQQPNEAGAQGETPRIGNLQQPVIVRHVGWGWLRITGVLGYLIGRVTTTRRRPYGRDEGIGRDRVA
jgi:hypothetical protein